ncbi:MAG: hypothetical protein KGL39_04920 [Patescibacteria group bacterium]|nr:hypothetical protein [Patescibacteria group bacterium]
MKCEVQTCPRTAEYDCWFSGAGEIKLLKLCEPHADAEKKYWTLTARSKLKGIGHFKSTVEITPKLP